LPLGAFLLLRKKAKTSPGGGRGGHYNVSDENVSEITKRDEYSGGGTLMLEKGKKVAKAIGGLKVRNPSAPSKKRGRRQSLSKT